MWNAKLDESHGGLKIAGRKISNLRCADDITLMAEKSSLVAQMVKRLPTLRETEVRSLGWEDLLEKEMAPTPVLLPGKSHGRTLVGHSPWGHKELDTTERLHFCGI